LEEYHNAKDYHQAKGESSVYFANPTGCIGIPLLLSLPSSLSLPPFLSMVNLEEYYNARFYQAKGESSVYFTNPYWIHWFIFLPLPSLAPSNSSPCYYFNFFVVLPDGIIPSDCLSASRNGAE
jgi:hypothetical protein